MAKGGNLSQDGEEAAEAGVEEGNSLKKHYVTEECVQGSMFKGPRLRGEKGGFVGGDLAAWQAAGRAPFPVWFIMLYSSV